MHIFFRLIVKVAFLEMFRIGYTLRKLVSQLDVNVESSNALPSNTRNSLISQSLEDDYGKKTIVSDILASCCLLPEGYR